MWSHKKLLFEWLHSHTEKLDLHKLTEGSALDVQESAIVHNNEDLKLMLSFSLYFLSKFSNSKKYET